MVARTVDRLESLDIAINNAGTEHPPAALLDLTEETFDREVSVNLRGTFAVFAGRSPHDAPAK
jgi:NAD(P)-dependent dehydrogenase (short-subunit alcohol dehydrogenase family)